MSVKIRNKFIEIKYSVSNGLVLYRFMIIAYLFTRYIYNKLSVVQNFGNK